MSETPAPWPCGQGHLVPGKDAMCYPCRGIGEDALSLLRRFLAIGIGLAFLAGIILAASWPGVVEDCDYLDDECIEGAATGSDAGLVFGWITFAVADTLILIALMGLGVRLGIRAARYGSKR